MVIAGSGSDVRRVERPARLPSSITATAASTPSTSSRCRPRPDCTWSSRACWGSATSSSRWRRIRERERSPRAPRRRSRRTAPRARRAPSPHVFADRTTARGWSSRADGGCLGASGRVSKAGSVAPPSWRRKKWPIESRTESALIDRASLASRPRARAAVTAVEGCAAGVRGASSAARMASDDRSVLEGMGRRRSPRPWSLKIRVSLVQFRPWARQLPRIVETCERLRLSRF